MADILARQRAIVASTADWTANNIVLGNGELAVERVSSTDIRIKVGDGVSTFLALPYASSSSTGIPAAVQTALDAKVAKSGDTMTGLLVLSGDPVAALGAVTKQSLDAAVSSLSTSLSGKFDKSGGTFTGPVSLAGDPTSSLMASTKFYTDAGDALKVSKSGDTMTGALVLAGDPVNALDAAPKQFVESGPWQTTVGGSSAYAGKVPRLNSVGVLDSSVVPPAASYLGQVNLTVAYALTGSFTAGNFFVLSASGTIHSSWPSRLNGTPTTCSAGQFIYYNSNGKWDLVGETSGATAINGKVDRTGDTMTGPLVLAGNPTLPLGAATKQFVEQFLPLSGGTLTGALTLAADPTLAMQASTKQFAEGLASARVAKSGDTMTGPLTLSGAPTVSLHSATKGYVDTGLSGKIDIPASSVRGDLLFYNGSTWARLPAGTSGNVLRTNGAGADPAWAAATGGGMTLLGTLTTTSGNSQTLSGLSLTNYEKLYIVLNNVGLTSGGASTINMTIDGAVIRSISTTSAVIHTGFVNIDLETGITASFSGSNSFQGTATTRNSSTSITLALTGTRTFTGGSVKIYGVA